MRMCAEHRLNLGNVELMLMTNVIATFNEEVFSNWRSQTVTGRSSLRSIVTFLTIQEDMARDRWFMESRFVLASAVKAAQEKLLGKRENSLALPSEAKKPVPAAPTQGCSHWDTNPPKGNHPPPSSGRLTPGSDSGNRRKMVMRM